MPALDNYQQIHMFDSHSGTHLVPPAYACAAGFDIALTPPKCGSGLEITRAIRPRGSSDVTWRSASPADAGLGARNRCKESWKSRLRRFRIRSAHGGLKAGEIVIFRSGYSDGCMQASAEAKTCMSDALNGSGKVAAPGPDAILYLAKRGIRAVGTDSPTLAASVPRALMTYWALARKAWWPSNI